jgi:hypothetical protein
VPRLLVGELMFDEFTQERRLAEMEDWMDWYGYKNLEEETQDGS